MSDFSTLVEPFDTLDTTTLWSLANTGDATVAGSELRLRPDFASPAWGRYIRSQSSWVIDYNSPAAGVVEFVPFATRNNGKAGWGIFNSSGQGLVVEQVDASTYRAGSWNGSALQIPDSYSTTDRYWRLVWSTSSFDHELQSSADGVAWTRRSNWKLTGATIGYTWGTDFFMRFRVADGTGTTPVAGFRGINEPNVTRVTVPSPATATATANVPVVQKWTTVTAPVATAAAVAPAPTLTISVVAPYAAAYALLLSPTIELPIPVAMSPPVATASAQAVAPTDVIAPAPNQITVLTATATAMALVPNFQQIPNTYVNAPVMGASVILLPPGEYVRISAPPALSTARAVYPLRGGPALSLFAATVVQTPQNFGGAAVYYRLQDQTVTLTDLLGGYHGGWSGSHPLVAGAVANDPDQSTQFDGTTTVAYNGLMPNYQSYDWRGDTTHLNFMWRADEWPHVWGYSAMVVFRTLPGTTKELYLFSRNESAFGSPRNDLSLRIKASRLVARWTALDQGNWFELTASPAVTDGAWHMAVMTSGYPMDDDRPRQDGPCRLYLDGVLQAIGSGGAGIGTQTPTRPLTVGGSAGFPSMEGALDEFAEMDYTVSKWEVLELWNQLNNLTGPPLRLETTPAYASLGMVAPTIRKSPVRPLNEFFDDFAAPGIDTTKWRDASPTARVINGSAVLRASGEQLLTADYFQAKDSSFIFRVDALPFREGSIFIGLVNEHDIVPDAAWGGINGYDPWRQHQTIGFQIDRYTRSGRVETTVTMVAEGEDFHGTSKRVRTIPYIPNDPNHPSPMRWLRLDIDIGDHGGATWLSSPDGVNWTIENDVHGGKASAKTTLEWDLKNGTFVEKTTITYEDEATFYLFHVPLTPGDRPQVPPWRGTMRVKAETWGGNAATDFRFDNINVLPQGTGTPAAILAKPGLIETTTTIDFLQYVLRPRVYSSAQDITIEVPTAWATARFPVPPPPVYVFAPVLTAQGAMQAPERAGDALPVVILVPLARAQAGAPPPREAGQAQNRVIEVDVARGYAFFIDPAYVDTAQSSPAPTVGTRKRVITLKTRRVRVSITQN